MAVVVCGGWRILLLDNRKVLIKKKIIINKKTEKNYDLENFIFYYYFLRIQRTDLFSCLPRKRE